jgi:hypothetical protein
MELRHDYHYSRGRAQPGEPIEDSGTDLQFGDLAVEVMLYNAFAKQFEVITSWSRQGYAGDRCSTFFRFSCQPGALTPRWRCGLWHQVAGRCMA